MNPNNQAGEGESTRTQTPAEAATEARVQSILFHQLENAFLPSTSVFLLLEMLQVDFP